MWEPKELLACRYVFPDEAAASASADGRSGEYVVARSEEDALLQAQSRYASAFQLVHSCYRPAMWPNFSSTPDILLQQHWSCSIVTCSLQDKQQLESPVLTDVW